MNIWTICYFPPYLYMIEGGYTRTQVLQALVCRTSGVHRALCVCWSGKRPNKLFAANDEREPPWNWTRIPQTNEQTVRAENGINENNGHNLQFKIYIYIINDSAMNVLLACVYLIPPPFPLGHSRDKPNNIILQVLFLRTYRRTTPANLESDVSRPKTL